MTDNQACENTDREIWRGPDEGNGSYYADSIHVTKDGGIGINVGGRVIVMPAFEWHALATGATRIQSIDAAQPTSNTQEGLLFLASELEAFHDCADGDVSAGGGHFRLECISESEQQRLNLRAVLRDAAKALRIVAAQPPAAPVETSGQLIECPTCMRRFKPGEHCEIPTCSLKRSSAATGDAVHFANILKDEAARLRARADELDPPTESQPATPSDDLAARAAELLTVPMGWGSGPALNALAEKIGGPYAEVGARNQTFREALEEVVRMGGEPQRSTGNALAERLRRHVDGDHQRGCQGRQYSCSCGYDATTEELLALAASEIVRLTNEPQSLPTLIKGAVYELGRFGPAEYVGLDNYHGETTHEFRTSDGRPRYIKPDQIASTLSRPQHHTHRRSEMQPHQERVVAESNELRDRLLKLTAFISKGGIFDTLDAEDQHLLREQRDAMADYLDALGKRIARFT